MTVAGSGDGLWENDLVNNKQWWSPRLYEMYGYKNNEVEVSFETFVKHIHPEDKERVVSNFQKHLQTNSEYDVIFRVVRKDGTTFWTRARGKTLRDENGAALKSAGTVVGSITRLFQSPLDISLNDR